MNVSTHEASVLLVPVKAHRIYSSHCIDILS